MTAPRSVPVDAGAMVGVGFGALRRVYEAPPTMRTSASWLVGEQSGVAIVSFQEPLLSTLVRTVVAAEISPPIYAGLRASQKPHRRFAMPHGQPIFCPTWPELEVHAADEARAAPFFTSRRDDLIFPGAPWVAIQDSMVEVMTDGGFPGAAMLEAMVEHAVRVADDFSARARSLTPRAHDKWAMNEWHQAAVRLGASHDAERWHLTGEHKGIRIEARLDALPTGPLTVVRAFLRRPLDSGLLLRRNPAGIHVAKNEGSLRLGYEPQFDAQFVISALQVENARAALASDVARRFLSNLAVGSFEVMLDDVELVVAVWGQIDGNDLAMRVDAAATVADILTPEAPRMAYR